MGNEIGELYRRGKLDEAVAKAREADPSVNPGGVMTGVQALMETEKFRDAVAFGTASTVRCGGPAAECLKTLVCYAAMMERPGRAARERLRGHLAILGACDDGFSLAFADRWEVRLRETVELSARVGVRGWADFIPLFRRTKGTGQTPVYLDR